MNRKQQLKQQRKTKKRIAAKPIAAQKRESGLNQRRREIREERDPSRKAKLLTLMEAQKND